jgi:hypothetical protein
MDDAQMVELILVREGPSERAHRELLMELAERIE